MAPTGVVRRVSMTHINMSSGNSPDIAHIIKPAEPEIYAKDADCVSRENKTNEEMSLTHNRTEFLTCVMDKHRRKRL